MRERERERVIKFSEWPNKSAILFTPLTIFMLSLFMFRFYEYFNCDCKYTTFSRNREQKWEKMYIYTLNSYNSTDLGKVSNSVRAVIWWIRKIFGENKVRSKSAVNPFFLRTKLGVSPLSHRLCTDFAPTLVRRMNEGRTKEERRKYGGRAMVKTKNKPKNTYTAVTCK